MNIQHSSRTDRWFTPLDIILRVRDVLGRIDVDPATEPLANARIGATYAISKDGELPETPWLRDPGTVYCNPPGGKLGNRSMTGLFWQRMMQERDSGLLTHGVFMCFSIEALQHTQRLGCPSVGEFPCCIPKSRIAFDRSDGTRGKAPSHSNLIAYVPGTVNAKSRFVDAFQHLGIIINA